VVKRNQSQHYVWFFENIQPVILRVKASSSACQLLHTDLIPIVGWRAYTAFQQ